MRPDLLAVALAFLLFLLPLSAAAAEPVPGDPCGTAGAFAHAAGPEVGGGNHFMICDGRTWKSALTFNNTAQVTQIGNQICNTGEILKFDGTKWACAVDDGTPVADSIDFDDMMDSLTLDASTVISVTGTNVLKVTNTGTGVSLLVEDAASTDTTPFVIDAAGNVGMGTSSPAGTLHVLSGAGGYCPNSPTPAPMSPRLL